MGRLEELLGAPVRVGRFRQAAHGIYKITPQVIRLKTANDLATLTHELGHHIDYALLKDRPWQLIGHPLSKELEVLGMATSKPRDSRHTKIAEGIAEYFRLRFSDPAEAATQAPQYHAEIEAGLAKQPELKTALDQAERIVQDWLAQDLPGRLRSRIERTGVTPKDDARTVTQKLETAWVDDLARLRHAVQDLSAEPPVNAAADAYVLARLARGAAGKASGFVRYGVRRADGSPLTKVSFEQAIKPVRARLDDFGDYLVALRTLELAGRNIETGVTTQEARATVDRFTSTEFEGARRALATYQDALLDYAVEGGVLNAEQVAQMRALNRFYTPFHRLLGEEERGGGTARRIADRVLPGSLRRIKGSGRDIIDPLESIVQNTYALVDLVEKNRAMQALVRQATQAKGGGKWIEAIPQPMQATTFNLKELERQIVGAVAHSGAELPTKGLDLDTLVTIFQPQQMKIGQREIVSVLEHGTRVYYAVNDKALGEALTAIGPQATSVLVKVLGPPARTLRAGATLTVGFATRNPIRDTFVAAVQSRYGFKPGVDTMRGLFEYLRTGESYQQWLNSGAGQSALVSADRNHLRAELRRLANQGRLRDHVQSILFHPLDAIRAFSEATETATRLGEFMRAVKKEGATEEGFTRAGLAARDVSLDFARAGTIGREWNQVSAFLNATIQGYARIGETFRRDPVGATIRSTASITVLSALLWALNHDDDEYRALPDWERKAYWHLPRQRIDGGEGFLRIPKPFELGAVFGTAFERALDFITDSDPEGWKRLFVDDPERARSLPVEAVKQSAWGTIMALAPTGLLPIMEVGANYWFFGERPIVTDDRLPVELQYGRYTSETAKFLGTHLQIAPAKIDHILYGYTGGLGRGVVQAAEAPLTGDRPAQGPERAPLIGTFYRPAPGFDSQHLVDFYHRKERLEGLRRGARRSERVGDLPMSQRLRGDVDDQQWQRITRADRHLQQLRLALDQAFHDASRTPQQKRERIQQIGRQMDAVARLALGRPLPKGVKLPVPARLSSSSSSPLQRPRVSAVAR